MFDMSQYGVNTSSGLSAMSGLASMIPVVGPMLGAGMNLIGQMMQNRQQEKFYNEYMSPAARMAQMRAAGINPNAAAQGISGAAAPQMNAAAPTSAFSSLGEALGQSVNTGLTAGNIAAQTKNLEVQTEGQDLMNKMTEVELGMKPSLLSAELDELKESANEKRQAVEQSKAEVKKIDQEVDNLKTQKEYLLTQIGLAEYDKRLKDAETRAANAKAALDSANKELAEVNKEIQEKERDNYLSPEERITKEGEAQEKVAVAAAKAKEQAHVETDPVERTKDEITKSYQKEAADLNRQIAALERELRLYDTGKKKDNWFHTGRGQLEYELRGLKNKLENVTSDYQKKIRRFNSNVTKSVGKSGFTTSQ